MSEVIAHLADWIKLAPTEPGPAPTIFGFYEEIVGSTPKQVFVLPTPLTYTPGKNSMMVKIDGVEQSLLAGHYAETNPTTITLAAPISDSVIKFRWL